MTWTNCPVCDAHLSTQYCECGWMAPALKVIQGSYRHLAEGITREQFGLALHDAIWTVWAIKQLQENRSGLAALRAAPGMLKQWQVKERALKEQVAKLMSQLPADDAAEMARR